MSEPFSANGMHISTEMEHLLDGVSEDREQIIANFYRLAAGIPDSEIVQFALFSKVLLEDIRVQQTAMAEASTQLSGLLSQNQKVAHRLASAVIVIALAVLSVVVWITWQDHLSVQRRIVSGISSGTSDALQRLNADSSFVRYLATTGIEAQLDYGPDGNPVLILHGRPGITVITEAQLKDGKLYIPLKR
jgi:hypothetical protein